MRTILALAFATAALLVPAAPAAASLVSWWPAEGTADDAADGNHGVLSGDTTFAPGFAGSAFSMDGSGDFVHVADAPNLDVAGGDFTVAAWVSFDSLPFLQDMDLVTKMSAAGTNTDGWRLFKQAEERFWFCLGGGDVNGCSALLPTTVMSTTEAASGPWFHVAGVKSATQIAIYVNGVKEASKPLPAFTDTGAADVRLGSYVLEGGFLHGRLDDARIYDHALSDAAIAGLAGAPFAYTFTGFFPPVQNAVPEFNRAHAGRAVPLKFALGGDQGLDVLASGYPRSEVIACGSGALLDGTDQAATAGGSGLTFDPETEEYSYVWKTEKGWAGTCRQLVLKLADGSTHRANFRF